MTTHPIEEGALARVLTDVGTYRKGEQFRVEEYVEPPADDDREPGDITEPHYYGSNNGGYNNIWVPAYAVGMAKTAAQMSARHIPTLDTIRDEISSALLGDFETFETDETDRDHDRSVEVYGRTHDGLTFGFRVTVAAAWETDE